MAVRKGYEAQVYIGVAGAQATTLLVNAIDISEELAIETAETTKRGDGTAVPHKSEVVVTREKKISFSMTVRSGDTALATLIAAADSGTPLALRTKRANGGTGFDGDVNLSYTDQRTLKGVQVVDFSATINDELRDPQYNV